MALIDITPVMTSNNIPSPYIVSASSIYNATYDAWKAFDNNTSLESNAWLTANGTNTGWIKLDFSVKTKISAFSVSSHSGGSINNQFPKTFILYGSNDDIVYDYIKKVDSQILWAYNATKETRMFLLDAPVIYRYYKLVISENNGYSAYVSIGELKFWQDDGATQTITNLKASMNYCLPRNTTLAFNQRQNDSREGMLAYANDIDNYGTLWMINNKGQAQIPLARTKNDVLFDGVANTKNVPYVMINSYKKYNSLLVIGGINNGTGCVSGIEIPTSKINTNIKNNY
jgi:hypothetical protein